MKRYRLTIIGLVIAVLIGFVSNLVDLDPFDNLVRFFASVEEYELDEIFMGFLVFLVFLTADLLIHQRNQKIEAEKVKIYKAMIYSSHHIINNFLNQMLIFKMAAEDTPGFDQSILKLYDEIIADAKRQVEALTSITDVSEDAIQETLKPKPAKDDSDSEEHYANMT